MKFVVAVYPNDNRVTTPCGFGVLENSGVDLEEKAQGEITISGVTVQASLELSNPVNPAQTGLDLDSDLQPTED